MRIGIDIDDTIAKTNERLIKAALDFDEKRVKGKGFKDPKAYSFMEMFYWNVVDVDTFMKTFRKSNAFLELEPIEGASEYINKLKEDGHEIIFITRRTNKIKTKRMTKKWLKKNNIPYDDVFFEIKDKGKFASELGIDYFIDNDEKNVYSALEYNIKAYLMETRYNVDVKDVERVKSWEEFYKKVK